MPWKSLAVPNPKQSDEGFREQGRHDNSMVSKLGILDPRKRVESDSWALKHQPFSSASSDPFSASELGYASLRGQGFWWHFTTLTVGLGLIVDEETSVTTHIPSNEMREMLEIVCFMYILVTCQLMVRLLAIGIHFAAYSSEVQN